MMELLEFMEIKKKITQSSIECLLFDSLKQCLIKWNSFDYRNATPEKISTDINTVIPLHFSAAIMGYSDNYSFFRDRILDLKNNLVKYEELYNNVFTEKKSKDILLNVLNYRLSNDYFIFNKYDLFDQYFTSELVDFSEDDVYVDCGGYTGDSVCEFILNNPNYKKIYVYEPFEKNANLISSLIKEIVRDDSITVRTVATHSKNTSLFIELTDKDIQNRISDKGNVEINAVKLDDDIHEKISFIKMDIEGSELATLEGAVRHIQDDSPTLALSIYHKFTDLYEIPKFIKYINPGYDFYLRHYTCSEADTVLYAIPKSKNKKNNRSCLNSNRFYSNSLNICKKSIESRILRHFNDFINGSLYFSDMCYKLICQNDNIKQ